MISALILTGWILWLDQTIQNHFEGQRWALPARVFARPLELYPGKQISLVDIKTELDILGYRSVGQPSQQGEFSISSSLLLLSTRGFSFVDSTEPAQQVSIRIANGRVTSLRNNQSGQEITLLRIEPVEIAKIYPTHNEDRVLVKIADVPPFLIKTLLAIEDRNFYEHVGIDPRGIVRAFLANLKAMKIKQGASTLTQQLIKNFYLTRERTVWRKFNEMIMALLLEYHYGKDEILEAYLNEVFLGQDNQRAIHGFGLASEYYFSAPLKELRSDQMAMLVGMAKGASYYDPRRHPERAKKRRDIVLKRITELGVLTADQRNWLLKAKLDVRERRSLSRSRYPAFTDLVRNQLKQNYDEVDLKSAGLRVFTTLDPLIQKKAEKALSTRIRKLEQHKQLPAGQLQGAVIVTDIKSGEILAVVGGRDKKSSYNRAIHASRQVGSLIKPVVYLEALEHGRTLATMVHDGPVSWENERGDVWRPENYDKNYHGDIPIISALSNSYNTATVALGRELGIGNIVRRLQRLGLKRSVPAYPSLLLGAVELTPMDVSRIYQPMANDGFSIPPRTIKAVMTQKNKSLQRYDLQIGQVIAPGPAYLIKYAMSDVVGNGTGRAAAAILPDAMPLAGKTGTTDNLRDSWFAGFDKNTLSVVWLGRDDNKPAELTGSSGALRVWIDLMKTLPRTPIEFELSGNIDWYWLNPDSGKLTIEECTGSLLLPFVQATVTQQLTPCDDSAGATRGIFEGWLN